MNSVINTNPEELSPQMQLQQYQKNMKIFINTVQKEMANVIDRYEKKIRQLLSEIDKLKKQTHSNQNLTSRIGMQEYNSQILSPIKFQGGLSNGMESVRSDFFEGIHMKNFFENNSNHTKTRSTFISPIKIEKSIDKLSKSRFEVEGKRKKQQQQDLLQSLEMGKANLQINTDKMFNLLGKTRRGSNKQFENEDTKIQSPTLKKKKTIDSHNTSLSSICDSLNNSFHGKKAQAKGEKRRQQKQKQKEEQRNKQKESQRKKKQQGVKNLLTTMRKNIESPDKQNQIIKASKLLVTGEKSKITSSKAKVMINPVAVDISNRNRSKQHNTTMPDSSKQIHSILKNTNNILSRSFENISAISFHDSGPDY